MEIIKILVESKMAEETVGAANKLSDLERYQDLSQQNVWKIPPQGNFITFHWTINFLKQLIIIKKLFRAIKVEVKII